MLRRLLIVILLLGISGGSFAQRGRWRFRNFDSIEFDRRGVPDWELDAEFPDDVFTFVRLKNDSYRGWRWWTDYPDSDLNFSFRLQQLTSLKVNPNPIILDITDPRLFDYPMLYIVEPGSGLGLTEQDVETLRRYIDNGGFILVDDFWGEWEWELFYEDIRRVFPDRGPPIEVPLEHPIFHIVYDLEKKPQIPSIQWLYSGRTYERHDAQTPHYRAYFDDDGGLQMMICHNTDLGDGWEREGEDERYFREFSEKWAYPLGINILFYAMTH